MKRTKMISNGVEMVKEMNAFYKKENRMNRINKAINMVKELDEIYKKDNRMNRINNAVKMVKVLDDFYKKEHHMNKINKAVKNGCKIKLLNILIGCLLDTTTYTYRRCDAIAMDIIENDSNVCFDYYPQELKKHFSSVTL